MRNRFTGAMVAATIVAAGAVVALTVMPISGQAAPAQGAAGRAGGAGQGRGAQAAAPARPARIGGKPNLNGVWQAIGTAYWNLEDHSAAPGADLAARRDRRHPGGPRASSKAARFRTCRRRSRSATRTAPAGRRPTRKPSATCRAFRAPPTCPTRSRSCRATGHPVRLRVREREPHRAHDESPGAAGRQLDGLVERPLGRRHAGDRGHRVSTTRPGSTAPATHHSDADEGHRTLHADGRESPSSTKRPSRTRRRSRGRGRSRMPLYRHAREERPAARVQVRRVLRRAALRRPQEEANDPPVIAGATLRLDYTWCTDTAAQRSFLAPDAIDKRR